MAERGRLTLLECAIAASGVLVALMFGVVLLIAVVRPADPGLAGRSSRNDRYVSVRHVAALKTFERAIVERGEMAASATSSASVSSPALSPASSPPLSVSAGQVLDGVAGCRREWQGPGGVLVSARRFLLGGRDETAPAEQIAAQLGELDAALLRFGARPEHRVARPLGLDAARWFAAAGQALATPIDSGSAPGQVFRVRCADLAGALGALRRGDAAMLDALAWRGTTGRAVLARWRDDQQVQVSERDVMRRNPWAGAAGCIYFRPADGDAARPFLAGPRSLQRTLCATAAMSGASPAASAAGEAVAASALGEPGPADAAEDARWQVPPSLLALLQPLEPLRQPTGALYRGYTEADEPPDPLHREPTGPDRRNRVAVGGAPLDVGYSIDITIDPALQALAQKTAACYTGRQALCRTLGMHRQEDGDGPIGAKLLESAMVRMAAVAVIDVASGRIEALAGALSPCAHNAAGGLQREPGCDARLPQPARLRPDALLNPAVFHDAMPASTIKPILAATFLADPATGPRLLADERAAMARGGAPARESLRGQLMRSDSARFLDRMFCGESGFVACRRPWDVQKTAARAFGWNAGCEGAGEACGQADLLFGRPIGTPYASVRGPGPTAYAYGRLMSAPLSARGGSAMHLMPPFALDADILRRCAAGPDGRRKSDDDWEKCRGGAVVDVVAEGWGQGHARATPIGVAGMMATLAAAANDASVIPRPHLVDAVRGVAGAGSAVQADALRWAAPPLAAPSREAAEVILSGLAWSHRAGTARTACEQVFDARRCQQIDWIAGKTGTPSFPGDKLTLDAIAAICREGGAIASARADPPMRSGVCGSLRPYKWYVATFRGSRSGSGLWTKAIAVLTERNWLRESGRVHGAGDLGPNPSAEIALQIVGRATGFIERPAP